MRTHVCLMMALAVATAAAAPVQPRRVLTLAVATAAAAATPSPRGVMSLDDATFEHNTQAASGQTTGRWLILLTPTASLPSPATAALARAARAAPGTHAAAVDTTASPSTASRFGDGPAIILLADRQLYRFDGDASSPDNDALAAFASDPEAAGVSGEPVPPPASADPVAAALAVIKSVWADVQARAADAGIDAESIKSKLASAGLDADALASRATAALDAAPGGAQGVAAAGLGGVALLAVAVARAGGRRAAGVAASPGIARPTRAAAKKRA